MRRRAIEVEVALLDVFAVIALFVGEAEQALFQDRIAFVPQRQRKAEELLVVRDASKPILAPAIGAGACLIVSEVAPRIAAGAVILADRAPLPLAQIRAPLLPLGRALARLAQALFLSVIQRVHVHSPDDPS